MLISLPVMIESHNEKHWLIAARRRAKNKRDLCCFK
jgi:hypothetical protein